VQKRPLPTAVNVHHRGQSFARVLRKAINRRHASRLTFKRADEVTHKPEYTAILRPFANDFDFERIKPWIKVGPQFTHGLRHVVGTAGEVRTPNRNSGQQRSVLEKTASGNHERLRPGSGCSEDRVSGFQVWRRKASDGTTRLTAQGTSHCRI
jgi:hypothetical protein